jgi:hypothetical protein
MTAKELLAGRPAIGDGGEAAAAAWELESRRQLVAFAGEGSIFNAVGFSPDGNVIGAGNFRGDVYLWRARTFEEIAAAETRQQKKIDAR